MKFIYDPLILNPNFLSFSNRFKWRQLSVPRASFFLYWRLQKSFFSFLPKKREPRGCLLLLHLLAWAPNLGCFAGWLVPSHVPVSLARKEKERVESCAHISKNFYGDRRHALKPARFIVSTLNAAVLLRAALKWYFLRVEKGPIRFMALNRNVFLGAERSAWTENTQCVLFAD